MKLSKIALRNILRNRRRSLLSLLAIALATAVIVFMFAYIEGLKYDQSSSVLRFTTGELRLRHPEFERYQFSYAEECMLTNVNQLNLRLKQEQAVNAVCARIQLVGQLASQWEVLNQGTSAELNFFKQTIPARGFGLDFNEVNYFSIKPYILPGGKEPAEGEILLGDLFAQANQLKVGDTVFFFTARDAARFKIAGLVALPIEQLRHKTFFINLQEAESLLGLSDVAQEILISFKDKAKIEENKKKIEKILEELGYSAEIKTWYEIGSIGFYLELAAISYNFIAIFFIIIGTTVIINTTVMVIYERMREIGTLRAMGLTGKEVVRLFFLEALFISLAASALGVLLGVVLTLPFSLNGFDMSKLADLSKMDLPISNLIYPQLNWYSTLFVFFYSVFVASLVSYFPSRQAARIEPIEALRSV